MELAAFDSDWKLLTPKSVIFALVSPPLKLKKGGIWFLPQRPTAGRTKTREQPLRSHPGKFEGPGPGSQEEVTGRR